MHFCTFKFYHIFGEKKGTSFASACADSKAAIQKRLKYIQGQVGGIAKMIEADRNVEELFTQISSVTEALRKVKTMLFLLEFQGCIEQVLKDGQEMKTNINERVRR